jgi:hypothetical protein
MTDHLTLRELLKMLLEKEEHSNILDMHIIVSSPNEVRYRHAAHFEIRQPSNKQLTGIPYLTIHAGDFLRAHEV